MARVFRPRGIEADGLKYYRERNKDGDYLSVDPSSAEGKALLEARATAIQGLRSSVCTTSVHVHYLRLKCRRVRKADVPAEWLEVL
jgi:hypothetical protein